MKANVQLTIKSYNCIMNTKNYKSLVGPYYEAFDNYNRIQFENNTPSELYKPIEYIMSIGGKRFRPICLLIGHHLFKPNWELSLPVAYAIELFHNFTLLHDDIMDEAITRRGKETVHKRYDVNSAILSGDVMMIYCYHYLHKIDDMQIVHNLTKVLTDTAIKVCEGQQSDINFESRLEVKEQEYIHMISDKTAVLIGAAFQMGGMLGGGSEEACATLYEYGKNIGIAFQILDDVLDAYGNESFGKKIGGDILQAKKTLLYIKAKENASESDQNLISEIYQNKQLQDTERLNQVYALFERNSVKAACLQAIEKYQSKAFSALDMLDVDTSILEDLSKIMIQRTT